MGFYIGHENRIRVNPLNFIRFIFAIKWQEQNEEEEVSKNMMPATERWLEMWWTGIDLVVLAFQAPWILVQIGCSATTKAEPKPLLSFSNEKFRQRHQNNDPFCGRNFVSSRTAVLKSMRIPFSFFAFVAQTENLWYLHSWHPTGKIGK